MAQALAGLLSPASGGSTAPAQQQGAHQRGRGTPSAPRPGQEQGQDAYDPYGGIFWVCAADLTFN